MTKLYALFKDGELVGDIPPSKRPSDVAFDAIMCGCTPILRDLMDWRSSPRKFKYHERVNNIVDEYGLIDFDEGFIIKATYVGDGEESL